ncbi:replication-associated recombination protein A [Flammeovirgaceae bacterium SG7u.111]|nr:replication-associated recombination protein A [Flammeovirgaceae bacterium SG7u.132]WPO35946.1 replication-associated recombination protein A [Flammeovirgaceae bacterium SG7u.111]
MKANRPPLSERIRPSSFDTFIGQKHLVGERGVIRKMVEGNTLVSMIFWGPPGVGKTTLANIIANQMKRPFFTLSAVSAGVKEVREVIAKAQNQYNTVLFIDEIHRFNKSQQDALLGAVEKGYITLLGATTENPSFEVNSALISRCQVYTLKHLDKSELIGLMKQAITIDPFLQQKKITLAETEALINLSDGDARKVLNLLEMVADEEESEEVEITDEIVLNTAQRKTVLYDKTGEQHYDIISAFIKSIRGSDPNAAVYYLARMIEGGEDPKFIARRLLIAASEDIGNANPTALVIATNCFQAVTFVGYPEARIILSQATTYLAASPKSNAAYMAINKAQQVVRDTGNLQVPLAIRNAPTKLMKQQGYGKGYKYSHNYENNFAEQEFLPKELAGKVIYDPGKNPREEEMRKRLRMLWKDKYGY